ncbi:hypothetical protein T4B_2845 [Trichinella pseudospiralis]|uniref:Uncharacterized protein n=1 Tax=Trichinella pseudospiralis TaxID=6337 RepID=A0A0V1J2L3_TRIPS|nr:hypothetical protein T4B_2845 [Trichinella pseudospiralis]
MILYWKELKIVCALCCYCIALLVSFCLKADKAHLGIKINILSCVEINKEMIDYKSDKASKMMVTIRK